MDRVVLAKTRERQRIRSDLDGGETRVGYPRMLRHDLEVDDSGSKVQGICPLQVPIVVLCVSIEDGSLHRLSVPFYTVSITIVSRAQQKSLSFFLWDVLIVHGHNHHDSQVNELVSKCSRMHVHCSFTSAVVSVYT